MIVAVDAGGLSVREAEHLALTTVGVLGPAALLASTHVVRLGVPHGAFALSLAPDADADADDAAAWAHRVRACLPGPAGVVATCSAADGPATAGEAALVDGALVALAVRSLRSEGRLVAYPGQDRLRGTLPVGEVPAVSAVDEVVLVGRGSLAPDVPLDTRGYVRPVWRDGRVALLVERVASGAVVPFEREHQRACCALHG